MQKTEEQKGRLRRYARISMRKWRGSHPGYAAKATARYRLRYPEKIKLLNKNRWKKHKNDKKYKESKRKYLTSAKGKELHNLAGRRYKLKNSQRIRTVAKVYYQTHKTESFDRARKWQRGNNGKRRLIMQSWRDRNRERYRFLGRQYVYRKKSAKGSHTLQEWEDLKKKYNYCCYWCGRREPFLEQCKIWLTEDHVIPLSKGGSNYISNIKPMCFNDNAKKWNKIIDVGSLDKNLCTTL